MAAQAAATISPLGEMHGGSDDETDVTGTHAIAAVRARALFTNSLTGAPVGTSPRSSPGRGGSFWDVPISPVADHQLAHCVLLFVTHACAAAPSPRSKRVRRRLLRKGGYDNMIRRLDITITPDIRKRLFVSLASSRDRAFVMSVFDACARINESYLFALLDLYERIVRGDRTRDVASLKGAFVLSFLCVFERRR